MHAISPRWKVNHSPLASSVRLSPAGTCSRPSGMHTRMLLGRTCCAPVATRRRQAQSHSRVAPQAAATSSADLLPFTQRGVALALGKFDALHRGHRALALTAAELGDAPGLLSFDGMAEVLGCVRPCKSSGACVAAWVAPRSPCLVTHTAQVGASPPCCGPLRPPPRPGCLVRTRPAGNTAPVRAHRPVCRHPVAQARRDTPLSCFCRV